MWWRELDPPADAIEATTEQLTGVWIMLSSVYHVVVTVLAVFWLIQVFDLFMRDMRFFESHTHKLAWFLVLVAGNVVGAVWYYFWKRAAIAARSVPGNR
jgi:hypothetical protein